MTLRETDDFFGESKQYKTSYKIKNEGQGQNNLSKHSSLASSLSVVFAVLPVVASFESDLPLQNTLLFAFFAGIF